MNKFTIFYCDDEAPSRALIESYLMELGLKYTIDYRMVSFDELIANRLLSSTKPDLLILDMLDKQNNGKLLGNTVLQMINASEKKIPTIVYSQGKTGTDSDVNLQQLKKDFPFVIDAIKKFEDATDKILQNLVEEEILKNLPQIYQLKNEYDLILKYQISAIGENNLNQILKQVKDEFEIKDEIIIDKMVAGFSGAVLFNFEINNSQYVLKISTEKAKLEVEFSNSQLYYHKFPAKFFNYISPYNYYNSKKNVLGILIKLVDGGKTLFDFILETEYFEGNIEPILVEIFTNHYGLKKHYASQRSNESHWSTILEKFSGNYYSIIEEVIKELSPLTEGFNFDKNAFKNFITNQVYNNLDKTTLHITKRTVLCHGDLHSKNILIQDTHPFLIDTGGITYGYWCYDICRLIVDLYIKGIGYKTRDFYDINQINSNVDIAKLIIEMKELPLDSKNDNIIKTINWLIKNCPDIYGDLYTKFEFQLGLMREFLQVSIRVNTVTHCKRAIALQSAYNCMLMASLSVIEEVK